MIEATRAEVEPRLAARSTRRARIEEQVGGWVLLLPACLALVGFVIVPMVWGVVLSFRDERLTAPGSSWAGLANWRQLLQDGSLPAALRFTALSTVLTVLVSLALGLALALALIDRPILRRVVGMIVLLPVATSIVVGSAGWRFLFDINGAVNQVLAYMGLHGPNWLNETNPAKFVIILVGCWSGTGFAFLLYEAALSRVPQSLRDAARLFNAWEGTRAKLRIVVPLLRRTTVVAVVVSTIVAVRAFDSIYIVTQGGPFGETRTLAYMVWEQSFSFFNLGTGAVAATLLIVIVLLITGIELLYFSRRKQTA